MSDIFISYANEDRPRAQILAQELEDQGWSIFWDRTIPIGGTWREVIGKELNQSRCVLVLWSKASAHSTWVHEEADDGLGRGILVPVLIENVQPPIGFRGIQTADLSSWDAGEPTQEFHRLIIDIAELIGTTAKGAKGEAERKVEAAETERKRTKMQPMLAALPKLGVSVGVGFLLGAAAVLWVEPKTGAGKAILIGIFIIVSIIVGGIVSRFTSKKKEVAANHSGSSKSK